MEKNLEDLTAIELAEELLESVRGVDMIVSKEKDASKALEALDQAFRCGEALKTVLNRHIDSRSYGEDTLGSEKPVSGSVQFVGLSPIQIKALIADLTQLDRLEGSQQPNELIVILRNAINRI